MKIIHERDKCIGCGGCVASCPDFWEMADDNKSKLKGSKLNPTTHNYDLETQNLACNQNAADSCPLSIIHIEK